MLASPNLSLDLIVTAGGTPIACNKSSLAANSGYFSHRLSLLSANPTSPPSLDLPTVPAEVFRSLLLFIYTGRLELTEENVYQLFWYSQMLQIPSALLHCTHFISSRPPPPPLPPALPPPAPPGTVVRPVARQGVPLLSLPSLASLYSDWVLRSSSSTTRLVTPDTSEENQTGSSRSQELKEKERGLQALGQSLDLGPGQLDTAACDGPVKFYRVVNEHFSVEDEVKTERKEEDTGEAGETYSCAYCNHVFKSHYCYQKHKRRHINPVTVEAGDTDKRYLTMKDLNVQYFPCKICGAKFPSYYFVHKHKKTWHKDQLDLEEREEKEIVKESNE